MNRNDEFIRLTVKYEGFSVEAFEQKFQDVATEDLESAFAEARIKYDRQFDMRTIV